MSCSQAVTEVVAVMDPVSGLLKELREPGFALIAVSQFGIGDAVVARRCREDVEVGVGPADGGLDDLVHPVEADVRRDEQAAPDRRLDHAAEAELQLHRLSRPPCCPIRLHAHVACLQSERLLVGCTVDHSADGIRQDSRADKCVWHGPTEAYL